MNQLKLSKKKRGKYDHKGTPEMEKLANKLKFSSEGEDLDDVEEIRFD